MKKILLILTLVFCMGCGVKAFKGEKGDSGSTGMSGTAGLNGHSSLVSVVQSAPGCSNGGITLLTGLDTNDSQILEGSEVTSSAELCNGSNGTNGTDTSVGDFTPVAVIDPCGDAAGIYDEIFLKLHNGLLIASFSDNASGKNTHFALLTAGSYVTTDGSSCFFSVDSSGNVYNQHY